MKPPEHPLSTNDLLMESIRQASITNRHLAFITTHLQQSPPTNIHANYPITSTKSLPYGATSFDIKSGKVFLPGDTVEYLSAPISDICHSLTIFTSREIKLELYEGDREESNISVIPFWWKQNHINFNKLIIRADDTTSFYIIVSTDPEGTPTPQITPSQPLLKGSKFNASVTADTDIFTTALSPTYPTSTYSSYFRIYATFDTAGVLSVRRTYSGTTINEQLYEGAALTADCAYVFDIKVLKDETFNIQYSSDATALSLVVSEIEGGI